MTAGTLRAWQFRALIALSLVALALVVGNISLFMGNRASQAQVLERQRTINQGIRLSRLNAQLIRSLATLSAQTEDEQIRALLAQHGVTFTFTPNASAAAPGSTE